MKNAPLVSQGVNQMKKYKKKSEYQKSKKDDWRNYDFTSNFEILLDERITFLDFKVYVLIRNLRNKKGYCWASNEYIATELNYNPHKISKSITKLEKLKYITRKGKNQNRVIFDNFITNKIIEFKDGDIF